MIRNLGIGFLRFVGLILKIINHLNYLLMRNLFLKQTLLLIGLFTLVLSCATVDELTEDSLKVTETFDYENFYDDYKSEIHSLDRTEFAGLNIYIRILALQDFSDQKKRNWWNDKVENTVRLKSLTKEQIEFIKKVNGMFSIEFYEKGNEKKYELADFVELNAYKVGFDDDLVRKVFMELNDIDTDFNLINRSPRLGLATPLSAKAISLDVEKISDDYSKPRDPISNTANCQNYGCFFCSPGGGCDCSTNCVYVPNACGVFGAFDCHAICCPEI